MPTNDLRLLMNLRAPDSWSQETYLLSGVSRVGGKPHAIIDCCAVLGCILTGGE